MKKLIAALCIAVVSMTACTETTTTKETTETTDATSTPSTETKVDARAQEIKDSTEMLDKKLADPNSTYSPDSLKK